VYRHKDGAEVVLMSFCILGLTPSHCTAPIQDASYLSTASTDCDQCQQPR